MIITRPSLPRAAYRVTTYTVQFLHSGPIATSCHYKYADKLQQKAQERGLNLEELKSQAREKARCRQKEEATTLLASLKKADNEHPRVKTWNSSLKGERTFNVRKDSSPMKPLSSILNLSKLMATPHTPSQISALWTAYHNSRSKGTGRGYISASLPLELYDGMMHVAKKYPVFVVPVLREPPPDSSAGESTVTAHEFFFLQWDFHPVPPAPSATELDPFQPVTPGSSCHVPEPSTVLFTPLQEYKLRTSFATPYLVLTFYTDLSQSHGIVLLRGEITPSSTSAATQPEQNSPERFLLNQVDAQLLTVGLQRYYLWGEGRKASDFDSAPDALLRRFHEEPEKFSWQDLLESSNAIA